MSDRFRRGRIWWSRSWLQRKIDQCYQIWLIIVFSWLIRTKYGWTPKWSPYGEIPPGKTLCCWVILELWLENTCLIMGYWDEDQWIFQWNYNIWIVLVMPFLVVCGTSHNSSWFESYGLTKLKEPHMMAWIPKRSKKSKSLQRRNYYLNDKVKSII